ncbi:MAG TPA: FtsQ-type POTRA domain-containing protein [Treponema sp.]|nr:FtsQ-type POTRA domain-containing protein [Treponema sp.]
MSEVFMFAEEEKIQTANWKPVVLKVLIAILAVFLLAEFAFYLLVIPTTSTIRMTIQGSSSVGYDEICAITGITGREKWFSFDTVSNAARLASYPRFESVSIEKKFPDKIVVTVTERQPVAIGFGTLNNKTVPVVIDRNGVVFSVGFLPDTNNLPVITGIRFENPEAGMRLHNQLVPLLQELHELESRNSVLLSSVSEIKIEPKTYGGYDLIIYPVHMPVRVKTDRSLNEDALQYMMLVLDVVQDLELDVEEIDIRAGTVAYRVREDVL